MNTLGDRLRQARRNATISQLALANLAEVSQGVISKIERGDQHSTTHIIEFARILGVSASWLSSGKGEVKDSYSLDNISTKIDDKGEVPLISWVQAGQWNEADDYFHPGEAEKRYPCPVAHGPHTYILKVHGDSMTSPYGSKSYPDGSLIYVDPDQRGSVCSGDAIIAKINGDNQVTFKAFISDGDRKYLKPLNPAYPVITDGFKVLGRIICALII